MLVFDFFQQECKIACFHSGATWSSQFVPIFPLSTLLMVSSGVCVCMVPHLLQAMFASVSFALTKNLRWDICKNKVRIHVSLNFFKLMQVCANDQSGFGILPHKSQIGYRYRQLDIFCRFRMIYCRSMVQSYDVGAIFGPPFVQCMVRTMFVQCS